MASSNSKKRKSSCSDLIFELSDDDVPPESEIAETNGEPKNKVLKFAETELLPGYDPQILESEKGDSTIPAEPEDGDITTDDPQLESGSLLEQLSEPIIILDDTSNEARSEVTSPLILNPESISMPDDDITMDGPQNKVFRPFEGIPESISIPSSDDMTIDEPQSEAVSISKQVMELVSKEEHDFTTDVQDFSLDIDFGNEPYQSPSVPQMCLTPKDMNQQFPLEIEEEPSICITFSDKSIAEIYKYKFQKFIESFVEFEIIDEDDLSLTVKRDSILDPSEWMVVDRNTYDYSESMELESSPVKHKKKRRKKSKKPSSPYVIDIKPEGNKRNKSSLYSFSKFEIEANKSDDDHLIVTHQSGQSCFNCAGNHSLRDCTAPKNHNRINAARNKHKSHYKNSKYQRYHISPDDQNYSHLRPGHISENLRDALGLRKNELPSYIYNMRRLGYPPGWLEEAKVFTSDFDKTDSRNKIHLRSNKKATTLDSSKIIDYPGFNVPCDKNIKDEYRYYNVPPYSNHYHKNEMIKYFESISKPGSHDKDKDKDHPQVKPRHKVIEDLIDPERKRKRRNPVDLDLKMHSPTLLDLEEQKKTLLAALTENLSVVSDESSLNEAEEDAHNENSDAEKQLIVEETLPFDTTKEETNAENQDIQSVKSTIYGTPLLKSCSPYTKLPDAESFMKDISPLINFENLPNSTGKYQQMRQILGKVRQVMNNSNGKA